MGDPDSTEIGTPEHVLGAALERQSSTYTYIPLSLDAEVLWGGFKHNGSSSSVIFL